VPNATLILHIITLMPLRRGNVLMGIRKDVHSWHNDVDWSMELCRLVDLPVPCMFRNIYRVEQAKNKELLSFGFEKRNLLEIRLSSRG